MKNQALRPLEVLRWLKSRGVPPAAVNFYEREIRKGAADMASYRRKTKIVRRLFIMMVSITSLCRGQSVNTDLERIPWAPDYTSPATLIDVQMSAAWESDGNFDFGYSFSPEDLAYMTLNAFSYGVIITDEQGAQNWGSGYTFGGVFPAGSGFLGSCTGPYTQAYGPPGNTGLGVIFEFVVVDFTGNPYVLAQFTLPPQVPTGGSAVQVTNPVQVHGLTFLTFAAAMFCMWMIGWSYFKVTGK